MFLQSVGLMVKDSKLFVGFILFCASCMLACLGYGQLSLTAIGTPSSMDFNIPGSNSCAGATVTWQNNVTIPNCYSNRPTYAYSSGCNNSGALHVAGTAGETAFGGRASNSTTLIIWGVRVVNNTGQVITALNIRYKAEQWNSAQSNVNNTVTFAYRTSATPITDVTSGSYTNFPALNMSSFVTQGGCGGGGMEIDGNSAAHSAFIMSCIPVNIPVGGEIMLRWYETNDACNDHMLCVDDLEITPLNNSMSIAPLTGPLTVCPSETGSYSVSSLPGLSYSWSTLPSGAYYVGGAPTGNQAQINWGTVASGTYTLTVSPVGSFCGVTLNPVSVQVNVTSTPQVAITAFSMAVCPGQSVQLSSSSPTGNTWNTTPAQQTQSITVNSPGTYILTAVTSCGTSLDTVEITAQNFPTVNLGPDTLICGTNTNITLNAQTANASYLWQNGSTNSIFQVTAPGTYHVAVTNACGTVRDTIQVNSQAPPVVNLGPDTSICGPLNLLLNAQNPGSTYQWSNSVQNQVIQVIAPGNYFVTVSNACGTDSDTILISNQNVPIVNLGADTVLCSISSNLLLNAQNSGATYLWQDGSTNPSFQVTAAGTYYVSVSNACGSATDTIHVTSLIAPSVNLGADTIICGTNINLALDAQNPGNSYLWQNGSTNQSFQVMAAGSYHVTVSNACGSSSDTIQVSIQTTPSVNLGQNTLICANTSFVLDAQNLGSSYLWQDGSQSQTFQVTTAGTYSVTVTNACGTASGNIQIFTQTAPVVDLGIDRLVCNSAVNLVLDALNGGNTFLWQDGSQNQTLQVTAAGTYFVAVTNTCGTGSDTVTIIQETLPVVDLGQDRSICPNGNILLNAQNPGASYVWQDNSLNQTFQVTSAGIYFVEVTNLCGDVSDTVEISNQALPTVNLGNDTSICGLTTNILLNAQNPANTSYVWQDNSIASSYNITQPGLYYVQVTNDCGSASDTMAVISIPLPQIDLGPDVSICLGDPVSFDASLPNATYLWQDNSIFPIFTTSQPGIYSVRVTNGCGSTFDSIEVFQKPGPQPVLRDTLLSCGATHIILDAQHDGATYHWSSHENSRTVKISESGDYWVEITYCGLSIIDSVAVKFEGPANTFFAPNSFSPNGDGINDTYIVTGLFEYMTSFYGAIYNRWGEVLYTSTNPDFSWNGECNGKTVSDGIYYGIFRITQDCSLNNEVEYGTSITVVR